MTSGGIIHIERTEQAVSAAEVVDRRLCMGCGFCGLPSKGDPGLKLEYKPELGHVAPVLDAVAHTRIVGRDFICPGAAMDMPALSDHVYGKQPQDELLGNYLTLRAGYTLDPLQRARSASGGIVPTVLKLLFDDGRIDAAYCVLDGQDPMASRGALIVRPEQLATVSGSTYHPADFGDALERLVSEDVRFAFVGLPCEIAALEMLKRTDAELARRHVLSIGLFCGGITTFDGVAYYLEGFGIRGRDVESIDYRHGTWPGSIRLRLRDSDTFRILPRIQGNSRWKILRYMVAFQGYWMLPRCRMCPDQVADFADIAVGDPHLPRFRSNKGDGYSIIVARTRRGEDLLSLAIERNLIAEEPITREEVVRSQGYTLDNRRHVMAYRYPARLFDLHYPQITTYAGLQSVRFRHRVYAFVDLMKIALPKNRFLRFLYLPWQVFEYLFLTFAPSLIVERIGRLLRNR